jgi:hypothetical protein
MFVMYRHVPIACVYAQSELAAWFVAVSSSLKAKPFGEPRPRIPSGVWISVGYPSWPPANPLVVALAGARVFSI